MTDRSYTPEQQRESQRIINNEDLYVIMGVSKNFNEKELRKQYKKVRLFLSD